MVSLKKSNQTIIEHGCVEEYELLRNVFSKYDFHEQKYPTIDGEEIIGLYKALYKELNKEQLYKKISNAIFYIIKYYRDKNYIYSEFYISLLFSLSSNLTYFRKNYNIDANIDKIKKSYMKPIFSYLNMKRIPIYESLLVRDKDEPKDILFAVGTIDYKVEPGMFRSIHGELIEIDRLATSNKKIQIYYAEEMTKEMFLNSIKSLKPKYLHIAGHGLLSNELLFQGVKLTPNAFSKFLNCLLPYNCCGVIYNTCFSLYFSANLWHGLIFRQIGYKSVLFNSPAEAFSESFYTAFFKQHKSYDDSFLLARKYVSKFDTSTYEPSKQYYIM